MKLYNYIILGAFSALIACGGSHEHGDHNGHDHGDHAEVTEIKQEVQTDETAVWYGEEFEIGETNSLGELETILAEGAGNDVTIKGTIDAACQKKGCWMVMKDGETEMRVRFLDYGFFVPKDCSGQTATIKGVASLDTISVEMLQHYAEDAGESEEEISKITEPEFELSFEATGVLIEK